MHHWPQFTLVCLLMVGLGLSLAHHEESRPRKENFGASVLAVAFTLWLLYEGGFFTGMF